MISELKNSRRVEFVKKPALKIISQLKKVSKNKVSKRSREEFFPNRNVTIWCLLINKSNS